MTGGPVNDEGFWDESTLDLEEGSDSLDLRIQHGRAALEAGADGDEPETMASDTISNILTALYGPAGTHSYGGVLRRDEDAVMHARDLLRRAFDSWEGDAEDYTRKVEDEIESSGSPARDAQDAWDREQNISDDDVDADGNLKGGLYSQEDAP